MDRKAFRLKAGFVFVKRRPESGRTLSEIRRKGSGRMARKIARNTFLMERCPGFVSYASTVGKMEGEGPLGGCFDRVEQDSTFGQDTWEKAESQMQRENVELALKKANLTPEDIDFLFAGDLLNQCISSTFGLRDLNIPFLGIYGACSTISEGILLSSLIADSLTLKNGDKGGNILAVTSSHFCTAERQFRLPLSYGGQRTPTAQWTCTASGAIVLSAAGGAPYVRAATIGTMQDLGVTDANNMGAAMAPAAASTIQTFLKDSGSTPEHFDHIVTGDLGAVGSELLLKLLKKEGIDISKQHLDCGAMMFDPGRQDVHAGGSGCGCAGSVLCGHFLPKLQAGTLKNILFMATGALMSTTSSQQGESIPAVAHLVWLSHDKGQGTEQPGAGN